MELLNAPGETIAQRYRLLEILGEGGSSTTYLAEDLQSSERVALKVLSLRHMTDWKAIALFEREAQVLAQLNHSAIPRYLEYFQVDTATQILEILVYLHQLTPPVIHRDIKPQNIIRAENGSVFLVDFGAVQDTYHHTVTGGTTVVGTYGYMAPEQFRGQAVLSTDLYGLGTTLLFLLTQKSPADLPQRQLKIKFRNQVCVSQEFADWLERMLEPAIASRFPSAKEALAVLRGEQVLKSNCADIFRQSKASRVTLLNTKSRLIVEIPPVWLQINRRRFFGFLTLVCKGILLPLLLAMLVLSIWQLIETPFQPFGYNVPNWLYTFLKFFIEFGMVFLSVFVLIGLWKMGEFLLRATSSTYVEIDRESFQLKRWLLGLCYQKVKEQTQDINQVKLSSIRLPLNKKNITFCLVKSKWRKHRFGLFLMQQEKEWLVGEVKSFLKKSELES